MQIGVAVGPAQVGAPDQVKGETSSFDGDERIQASPSNKRFRHDRIRARALALALARALTIDSGCANPITFAISLEIVHSFRYSRTSRRLFLDRVTGSFFDG